MAIVMRVVLEPHADVDEASYLDSLAGLVDMMRVECDVLGGEAVGLAGRRDFTPPRPAAES